jgi:plasmid stabilization system protein ParE
VWIVRHQHHFVFFRELPSGSIGIISILHTSMDLPARLKEDTQQIL